ncbi:MAG TPA: 3-hydroxyacyl-CoA dehydrogenase NAD-binding domain-containing protein, partial [Tabrizicola sp.]|nr:3-hydroxyacyl-CoA dehydrogenase NAD-binding domain-containing protein [Tabrizicola sp.]
MDRIVGVVGLGTMGLGIALVYAQAGFSVLATDSFALARASARDRLVAALAPRLAKGALDQASHDALLARITIVEDIQSLAPASLVIEAIIEEIAAKQALVASLESVLAPDAVIASNTSSLAVAAIAEGAKRPDRILGLHFFNPAQGMKLVDLVGHPATAPEAPMLAKLEVSLY